MPAADRTTEVLLVCLPPWDVASPHLGVACLMAYLRHHDVRCALLDANIQLYRSGLESADSWEMSKDFRWIIPERRRELFQRLGPGLDSLAQQIVAQDPLVLGVSLFGSMQYVAAELIDRVRALGFGGRVVLGGPACHAQQERDVLRRELRRGPVDAFVVGEGERALLEIVQRVRKGHPLAGIPEVVDGEGNGTGTPTTIINMDTLPFPDFSGFDLTAYESPFLSMQWTRGCTRRCAFCENGPLWGRFRQKSPRRIHDEFRHQLQATGLSNFSLCDTALNSSLPLMRGVCDLLIKEPLELRFVGSFHARADMEPRDYYRLRRAGCTRVEIGLESGSDRVLKLMNKSTTVAAGEQALRLCNQAGLEAVVFLMVGFPGETEQDHRRTLDFLRRNRELIQLVRSVNVCVVQFNVPLFRHPERYGLSFHSDSATWGLEWEGPEGNTLEVRLRRQREVVQLLDELNIPHELKTGADELSV